MANQLSWLFERFQSNGGTGARGLRRELSGSGIDAAQKCAREAVQNSGDASAFADKPVRIAIRVRHVTGPERTKILKVLGLDAHGGPSERKQIAGPVPDPLPLLYFEDFNTVGLGGEEDASRPRVAKLDRFVGLCRNFGDAAEDADGGGTFGYGKAVYWNASTLNLVLFHSRIAPTGRESVHSRLIGGALFNQHDYADARFTGRAWLGAVDSAKDYAAPLCDGEADKIAATLGLSPRADSSLNGTSILIVGSKFSDQEHLDALRRSIELNYWPRIRDNRLEVLLELDGTALTPPLPENRSELAPYLEAYSCLKAGPTSDDTKLVKDLVTAGGTKLGTLALIALDASEQASLGDKGLRNRVALLRNPGMIVQNLPVMENSPAGYVGVFKADPTFNAVLARSEGSAHNLWDSTNDDLTEADRTAIKALDRQIRNSVKSFLSSQVPEEGEKPVSCPELGKALGRIFSVPGDGYVQPETSSLQIRLVSGPSHEQIAGGLFVKARFEIESGKRQGAAAKRTKLRVSVVPRIAVEDGGRNRGRLACKELAVQVNSTKRVAQETVTIPVGADAFLATADVLCGPLDHDEQTVAIQPQAVLV